MSNFIVKCRAIKRIMNKCRKSCHNCTKFEASPMENMPDSIPVELIGENLQEPEIIIFQMKSKQETQSRPCRLVL